MRKKILIAISCLSIAASVGCSEKSSSQTTNENAVSDTKKVILEVDTEPDIEKCALTFQQLYDDADFIAEVKVKDISATFRDETKRIFTEITPEIINIYKGEYNDQMLISCGGVMNATDYAKKCPENINLSDYSDDEISNGLVKYNWLNNYTPQVNDTIIFFANYDEEDDCFYNLYENQGMYICDNDNVISYSLSVGDDWTEPLALDLKENYNASASNKNSASVLSCNKEKFLSSLV